jgi:hypothetical protein
MDTSALDVFVAPDSIDQPTHSESFAVYGTSSQGSLQQQSSTFTIRNAILSDEESRETIRWFLEDHATNDPFDVSKAAIARRKLKSFAMELAGDIAESGLLPVKRGSSLSIRIHGSHGFAGLPWELLEDKLPWAFAGVFFQEYTVERVVELPSPKRNMDAPTRIGYGSAGKKLNILMVTARTGNHHDVTPSNVSWPLAKIIAKHPGTAEVATLRLVRPATWSALTRELESKQKGFYDIIHLDMHGQVEDDR